MSRLKPYECPERFVSPGRPEGDVGEVGDVGDIGDNGLMLLEESVPGGGEAPELDVPVRKKRIE